MARNVRVLILALLCVLAVALAAATLTNPVNDTPGSAGAASPFEEEQQTTPTTDSGSESNTRNPHNKSGSGMLKLGFGCVPFLTSVEFILGAICAIILLLWLLKRRENFAYAFAIVFPLVLFLFPVWLAVTDCGGTSIDPAGGTPGALDNITDPTKLGGTASETTQQLMTPLVLLGLLLVVAVVLAYLTLRASGDDTVEPEETTPETPEETEEEAALEALGAAAGEAADRIQEPADVDNEVYRAWREMTEHLHVDNPDTSTPAEFADAARDAGMSGEHVERLTALFRDVRYGGESPTEDREQEAVDALRAIEETYAGGED